MLMDKFDLTDEIDGGVTHLLLILQKLKSEGYEKIYFDGNEAVITAYRRQKVDDEPKKEKELLGEPWADDPYRGQPEFTYSCEKRFIPCAPEKKDFGQKLSVAEFNQAMMELPHCSFIKPDIPEPKDNEEFYLKALNRMQGFYKWHVDTLKRKAAEKIDWETGRQSDLFNMAIRKREKVKMKEKKVINLEMWTAFKDEYPQNDRAILYANVRGVSLCREFKSARRLDYAWKDATHWIYVELPHFEDSQPMFDWSRRGDTDEEGDDYD